MARRATQALPPGFQLAWREGAWWLQRAEPPGDGQTDNGETLWLDVSGPYVSRQGAVRRAVRESRTSRYGSPAQVFQAVAAALPKASVERNG